MSLAMNRRWVLAAMAAIGAGGLAPAALAQFAEAGRLFYEMTITSAGTRSQGWHGTLFGPDGAALAPPDGTLIETHVGTFRAHPCTHPWTPCGMIREGTLPLPPASTVEAQMDPVGWTFRLFVVAEGSRSEGWRGMLWHGDHEMPATGDVVETGMGRFVPVGESEHLWGWSGWVPDGWGVLPTVVE